MKNYEIIGTFANFSPPGKLELSDEQYDARKHALKETGKKGVYEILSKVQFKRGERIGWDGEPSKMLLKNLEVSQEPKPVDEAKVE